MLEGAVMEYAKWFIAAVSILFLSVLVMMMFRMNEVNSFQQEVNYQIERHGGLTEDAKMALNEHAKNAYGGCIVKGPEFNAPCLYAADKGKGSSGFFIREFKVIKGGANDGKKMWYDRKNTEQARYGTQIRYALTRQIGNGELTATLDAGTLGSSSSRVRGTVGE